MWTVPSLNPDRDESYSSTAFCVSCLYAGAPRPIRAVMRVMGSPVGIQRRTYIEELVVVAPGRNDILDHGLQWLEGVVRVFVDGGGKCRGVSRNFEPFSLVCSLVSYGIQIWKLKINPNPYLPIDAESLVLQTMNGYDLFMMYTTQIKAVRFHSTFQLLEQTPEDHIHQNTST
jgi:hypothetical protein